MSLIKHLFSILNIKYFFIYFSINIFLNAYHSCLTIVRHFALFINSAADFNWYYFFIIWL